VGWVAARSPGWGLTRARKGKELGRRRRLVGCRVRKRERLGLGFSFKVVFPLLISKLVFKIVQAKLNFECRDGEREHKIVRLYKIILFIKTWMIWCMMT
jgi:hypothetical protein